MCTSPIPHFVSSTKKIGLKHSILVPCGKCDECLKAYQNQWYVRMLEELKKMGKSTFVTLTYDEANVPFYIYDDIEDLPSEFVDAANQVGIKKRTVCKKDVQDWLKRCRLQYERKKMKKMTFFMTAEYGPKTQRPHYHGILFGVPLEDAQEFFLKDWHEHFGFTYEREIAPDNSKDSRCAVRYTAKYCAKGSHEIEDVKRLLVAPIFHLISKGLGASYLTPSVEEYHLAKGVAREHRPSQIAKRLTYNIDNYAYKLPRYYKDRLLASRPRLQNQVGLHLLNEHGRLYDSKCRALQAANLADTHEAHRLVLLSDVLQTSAKKDAAKLAQLDFFSKSRQ